MYETRLFLKTGNFNEMLFHFLIKIIPVFSGLVLGTVLKVLSQDTSELKKSKLTFSGYADLYYQYDFNKPADGLRPPFIYNFKKHDQLNVNLALLKAAFESNKLKASLGIMAGNYATYNLTTEPEFFQYIYQADIGYFFSDKFSVNAGIFPSHLGCESAIAKDNWNLSRGLLAENSPYYETGIRFNYQPNEKWALSILGLNGWQHIKDNNSSKAIGTHIVFKPNEKLVFNSCTFIGNEKPDSAKQTRLFHDFYFTYFISSKFRTILQLDLGAERKPDQSGYHSWIGSALLMQYSFTKKLAAAGRIEFFRDPDGVIVSNYQPLTYQTTGLALGLDYYPFRFMSLRTEIRLLNSTEEIYLRNNQPVNSSFSLLGVLSFHF
jgi:hypothetical protein